MLKYTVSQAKNLMRRAIREIVDPGPSRAEIDELWACFDNTCAYCGAGVERRKAHLDGAGNCCARVVMRDDWVSGGAPRWLCVGWPEDRSTVGSPPQYTDCSHGNEAGFSRCVGTVSRFRCRKRVLVGSGDCEPWRSHSTE